MADVLPKKNLKSHLAVVLLSASRTVVCIKTWRSLSLYHTSLCPWLTSSDCANSGGRLLANSAVLGLMSDLTFIASHPQGGHNLRGT